MGRNPINPKENWLQEGYSAFCERGKSGINVEGIAKKLKAPKSGFYWFFETKDKFVDEVIDLWKSKETDALIFKSKKHKDPVDRLRELFIQGGTSSLSVDFLFHIRRASKKNSAVKKALAAVEKTRQDYLKSVFIDLGYDERDSLAYAEFLYCYAVGWLEVNKFKKTTKQDAIEEFNKVMKILKLKDKR